jgi:two-component system response regulator
MAPLRILHVEDDADDAFLFSRALKGAKLQCELHREINGEHAIDFLSKTGVEGGPGSHPVPDLMILDLKLPGLSGFEVLSWIQARAVFKTLPIIVLSGSSLLVDQQKASALGASAFLVKQSDYDQVVAQVIQFILKNGPAVPDAGRAFPVPPLSLNQ